MSIAELKGKAIVKKETSLETILTGDGFKKQVKLAVPSTLDANRMVRIALTELRKTPKLSQCTHASFLGAVLQGSLQYPDL